MGLRVFSGVNAYLGFGVEGVAPGLKGVERLDRGKGQFP